jgi:hypothetical protein
MRLSGKHPSSVISRKSVYSGFRVEGLVQGLGIRE